MKETGIVIVSHVYGIAEGIHTLIQEVAKNVNIEISGGVSKTEVGTSFEDILEAVNENPSNKLLAFYDLGSARMNLEMVKELTDKTITIYDVPIVEGAYTAAALLQADVSQTDIDSQLKELQIEK